MRIEIRNRYRPYTKESGARMILPGTSYSFRLFPTVIEAFNGNEQIAEHNIQADPFITTLDLEKGSICVGKVAILPDKERGYNISLRNIKSIELKERLSFGVHKKQDWQQIWQRKDMIEIAPFWHRLGLMTAKVQQLPGESLLSHAKDNPSDAFPLLKDVFCASFHSVFYPLADDTRKLGYPLAAATAGSSPLALLSEGAELIRSLFVSYRDEVLSLLPHLPCTAHAGRLIHMEIDGFGTLSIEWSKKLLRQVILVPSHTGTLTLHIQSPLKSYRLDRKERKASTSPLILNAGIPVFLDNFAK